MKAVILAGGLGTRISEETSDKPKPMVPIGARPILWHIIQIYALQGITEFIIAGGYKHEVISNWINESYSSKESWISGLSIEVKDTGDASLTGMRIAKCIEDLNDETFFCTYGDGVANVNLQKLLQFHIDHGKCSTVTVVHPPARFGHVSLSGDSVTSFDEKNQADEGWINGGFFVLNSEVKEFIHRNNEAFERGALPRLAAASQLMAYKHNGFWRPMDTLRDRDELTQIVDLNQTIPWHNF